MERVLTHLFRYIKHKKMTKLKITKEQYEKILLHEQQTRMKTPTVLNENLKGVVYGVALILGINLTGQNKEIGEESLRNQKVMDDIKATFEDEDKLTDLVDALEEKGVKNPTDKLSNNPEELVNKYNKIAEENGIETRVGVKAGITLHSLK